MMSCVYASKNIIATLNNNTSNTLVHVAQVTMVSIILVVHLQQKWQSSFDEDDELYQWHLYHEPIAVDQFVLKHEVFCIIKKDSTVAITNVNKNIYKVLTVMVFSSLPVTVLKQYNTQSSPIQ